MKTKTSSSKAGGLLLTFQGIYYVITGIWPLIHLQSFLAVTGPKEDIWLVRTFGVLTMAVGLGFLTGGIRKVISWPIVITALATALGLGIMDAFYALNEVIWDTYLIDAFIQAAFLLGWISILSSLTK